MTTALLVDDEQNLIDHMERLLNTLWPELEIVGKAYNGREAIALAAQELPDIVFLDIRMPGLSGIDVAEQLPVGTEIVFATAYDEYAIQAFERAAADYLLKPVTAERLQLTIDRLAERLTFDTPSTSELSQLIAELRGSTNTYLQWVKAGTDGETQLVPIDDVVYFKAEHKYTSVFTQTEEFLVRMAIKDLEQQLDPNRFWRIHRSMIVSVQDITKASRDLKGRYTLTLKRRQETLRTSQSYGHQFKQM